MALHRIPVLGDLLSPIIGYADIVTFVVNPFTEAAGRPVAFTYQMPSFDGTLISVNYFPAINVSTRGGRIGPHRAGRLRTGLHRQHRTDQRLRPVVPQRAVRQRHTGHRATAQRLLHIRVPGGPSYDGGGGYNVITWDPRGEFASGGQLQIDNPFYEGRDVSAIINWPGSANPAVAQVKTDLTGVPVVGMTGGSYGGGIQLTAVDPRILAIIPEIAWNSLLSSLYPTGGQFKTGFGTILAAALAFTGARVNRGSTAASSPATSPAT